MPRKRPAAPEVDRALLEGPSQEWAQAVSQQVMSEVRRRREVLDLRAADLSLRVAALGGYIPRGTLAKLENGTRKEITLPEMLLLAAALDVPPALLLAPLEHPRPVPALPGWTASAHQVWDWLMRGLRSGAASQPLVEDEVAHLGQVMRDGASVVLLLNHTRIVEQHLLPGQAKVFQMRQQRRAAAGDEEAVNEYGREIDRMSRDLDLAWDDVVGIREEMITCGYDVPEWSHPALEKRWDVWLESKTKQPWGVESSA